MRVAGLGPVDVPGIENINFTEMVPGHMAYRQAMPKLLREVGWMVECDEFSEIEDPDPENHEQRQRELINEIEEARKELEKKEGKKGFSFWRKKKAAKKDWELYDENSMKPIDKNSQDAATLAENPVLFDIDAMRAEIAVLSAEGIEVREIESTLPPMKIDMAATSTNPYTTLRETKSYNDSIGQGPSHAGSSASKPSNDVCSHSSGIESSRTVAQTRKSFEEYDEFADGGMTMTFDTSFNDRPSTPKSNPPPPTYATPERSVWETTADRPPLKPAATDPTLGITPGYNAWADEYDRSEERRVGKECPV